MASTGYYTATYRDVRHQEWGGQIVWRSWDGPLLVVELGPMANGQMQPAVSLRRRGGKLGLKAAIATLENAAKRRGLEPVSDELSESARELLNAETLSMADFLKLPEIKAELRIIAATPPNSSENSRAIGAVVRASTRFDIPDWDTRKVLDYHTP